MAVISHWATFKQSAITQLQYQLNSNSKYTIPLKAPPELMYMEIHCTELRDMLRDKYRTKQSQVLYLSLNTSLHAIFSINIFLFFSTHPSDKCLSQGYNVLILAWWFPQISLNNTRAHVCMYFTICYLLTHKRYSSDVTLRSQAVYCRVVIERLTSSACKWTKGAFLVITFLNNQHLAVIFCILGWSHVITRHLLIRNCKYLMN